MACCWAPCVRPAPQRGRSRQTPPPSCHCSLYWVANFIEREQLLARLQESSKCLATYALTNPLTGLANRRALLGELQRVLAHARREQLSVLVAMIDLDGFKQINDRHGHASGGLFLQAVTQRLLPRMRESDLLGRLGGDEFVIIGLGQAWQRETSRPACIAKGAPHEATHRLQQRVANDTAGSYPLQ